MASGSQADQSKKINSNSLQPPPPPRLKSLIDMLHRIYSDQPNELQVTTLLKYWLGGQDSLDYISIMQDSKSKKQHETPFPASMSISSNSLHKSCPLDYQPHTPESISLDGIETTLALYAAKYLMLAIKDRLRH
uniref:SUFU_C domain-containing protein n=1 Tax=Glossina austeni TaxID=7395 RepID=A0A1A9VLL0_GLOAU